MLGHPTPASCNAWGQQVDYGEGVHAHSPREVQRSKPPPVTGANGRWGQGNMVGADGIRGVSPGDSQPGWNPQGGGGPRRALPCWYSLLEHPHVHKHPGGVRRSSRAMTTNSGGVKTARGREERSQTVACDRGGGGVRQHGRKKVAELAHRRRRSSAARQAAVTDPAQIRSPIGMCMAGFIIFCTLNLICKSPIPIVYMLQLLYVIDIKFHMSRSDVTIQLPPFRHRHGQARPAGRRGSWSHRVPRHGGRA